SPRRQREATPQPPPFPYTAVFRYNGELVRSSVVGAKPAGLGVRNSNHNDAAESRYAAMAAHYGLIPTGGSDFHGARQGVIFHGDLGSRSVESQVVEELRKAAARQK
ncbi:hypothetical protein E4V51_30190, partial [Paenibacillus sp. 28ISP30-2]|nr:hypothetical protein [Paenibacillus sp. 28ISP30-2]